MLDDPSEPVHPQGSAETGSAPLPGMRPDADALGALRLMPPIAARFSPRTRQEILDSTPVANAFRDLGALVSTFTARCPAEMKILDRCGVHPLTSTETANPFDQSRTFPAKRNIGLHLIGAATTFLLLAKMFEHADIEVPNKEYYLKAVLLHDAVKRLELMFNDVHRGPHGALTGGDSRASLVRYLCNTAGLDGVDTSRIIEIDAFVNSTSFIENFLDPVTWELRPGGLGTKLAMLSDYMNTSSDSTDPSVFIKNVTPSEKPIVARWGDRYPEISKLGRGFVSNGAVVQQRAFTEESLGANEIYVGPFLAVQRHAGTLVCKEISRMALATACATESAYEELVKARVNSMDLVHADLERDHTAPSLSLNTTGISRLLQTLERFRSSLLEGRFEEVREADAQYAFLSHHIEYVVSGASPAERAVRFDGLQQKLALARGRFIEGTALYNLRDVGGIELAAHGRVARGILYRSDEPTLEIIRSLNARLQLPIRHVIDLRDPKAELTHSTTFDGSEITCHKMPLFHPGDLRYIAFDVSGLTERYTRTIERCRDNLQPIFTNLAKCLQDGPTLLHCSVGKDRTGLTVALLLELIGVARDEIFFDYSLSGPLMVSNVPAEQLKTNFDKYAINQWTSLPSTLLATFQYIETNYGGVREYLGLSDDVADSLRRKLAP